MRLVECSDHELVIRDRPGLFKSCFILVWSSFFIGIPGLLLFSSIAGVGVTRLDCTRLEPTQVNCRVSRSKFMGVISGGTTTYVQVTKAKLNQKEGVDSDGDDTEDNWVSLVTPTGEVTLFEDSIRYNGTRGSATEMVTLSDEVNRYLQSGIKQFYVERDLSLSLSQALFPVMFAGSFVLIGLSVLSWTFQIRLTRFDLNRDRVFWQRYSLLGVKRLSFPLKDIESVQIDEQTDSEGPSTYTLRLDVADRDRIALGTTHGSRRAKRLKTTIQNFLQLE